MTSSTQRETLPTSSTVRAVMRVSPFGTSRERKRFPHVEVSIGGSHSGRAKTWAQVLAKGRSMANITTGSDVRVGGNGSPSAGGFGGSSQCWYDRTVQGAVVPSAS